MQESAEWKYSGGPYLGWFSETSGASHGTHVAGSVAARGVPDQAGAGVHGVAAAADNVKLASLVVCEHTDPTDRSTAGCGSVALIS